MGQTTPGEREPLRVFVQEFYNWYVPVALSDSSIPPSEIALKERNSSFGPKLAKALMENYLAQAKSPGELVGLDFDPFLNAQDPCERYEVGTATRKGKIYLVDIYAICSGKKSRTPNVIPELLPKGNQWEFINFRYPNQAKQFPDSADLLSILKI
jgi:hypothetical protein